MKMKNLLLCILLLLSFQTYAQSDLSVVSKDTLLSYNETVQLNNVDGKELLIRARDWLNNNCKTLKIQDKETGEVSGACNIDGDVTVRFFGEHTGIATFDFVVTFLVKDNVYKYIISGINNTRLNNTEANGAFGLLYNSKHCYAKGLALSQDKLDDAYQSLKDGFSKSEKQLAELMKTSMAVKSPAHF